MEQIFTGIPVQTQAQAQAPTQAQTQYIEKICSIYQSESMGDIQIHNANVYELAFGLVNNYKNNISHEQIRELYISTKTLDMALQLILTRNKYSNEVFIANTIDRTCKPKKQSDEEITNEPENYRLKKWQCYKTLDTAEIDSLLKAFRFQLLEIQFYCFKNVPKNQWANTKPFYTMKEDGIIVTKTSEEFSEFVETIMHIGDIICQNYPLNLDDKVKPFFSITGKNEQPRIMNHNQIKTPAEYGNQPQFNSFKPQSNFVSKYKYQNQAQGPNHNQNQNHNHNQPKPYSSYKSRNPESYPGQGQGQGQYQSRAQSQSQPTYTTTTMSLQTNSKPSNSRQYQTKLKQIVDDNGDEWNVVQKKSFVVNWKRMQN